MDLQQQIDRLVGAVDTWAGGAVVPPWFDPEPGETVYGVFSGVELIELRDTELPLVGGTSTVDVAAAAALAAAAAGTPRSIWLKEDVPARRTGAAVVTSARVVFVGDRARALRDRTRSWRYDELTDVTHDRAVPETWISVDSRKRVSGLRCPGASALDLRFLLALALATARQDRPALRAWLLSQRGTATPSAPVPSTQAPAWVGKAKRGLSLVYLGKPGVPVPLRVGQGVAAGFITLAVLASFSSNPDPQDVELSANGGPAVERVDEAAQQADIDARKQAETQARLEAEQAAQRAFAERAAAEQAAADKAAAERAAAEQAAAERAAAEQAAAEKAAEQAAAEAAAREAAARAEAERTARTAKAAPAPAGGGCMAEYPDFCVPAGGDLDCPDVGRKDFTVLRPDSYGFDRDNDGVGCES